MKAGSIAALLLAATVASCASGGVDRPRDADVGSSEREVASTVPAADPSAPAPGAPTPPSPVPVGEPTTPIPPLAIPTVDRKAITLGCVRDVTTYAPPACAPQSPVVLQPTAIQAEVTLLAPESTATVTLTAPPGNSTPDGSGVNAWDLVERIGCDAYQHCGSDPSDWIHVVHSLDGAAAGGVWIGESGRFGATVTVSITAAKMSVRVDVFKSTPTCSSQLAMSLYEFRASCAGDVAL